jgi:predicted Zn-dependent protease
MDESPAAPMSGFPARAAVLLLAALVATACARPPVRPIGSGAAPFAPDADERALWARAADEQTALRERVRLHEDPGLEDYLARVAGRLAPRAARLAGGPELRVVVVRDPSLNAFAMPDGRIYVHTGVLSRLENEAQLATVLAREMVHVVHRDALRVARAGGLAPPGDALAGVVAAVRVAAVSGAEDDAVGPGVLGPTARAVLGRGLRLTALAAVSGYGPDLERQADAGAIGLMLEAGYDPREAPRAFETLACEAAMRRALETFALGSLPRLAERVESMRAALAAAPPGVVGGDIGDPTGFAQVMRPVVRENALEDLRAGRLALARAQLDRVLSSAPDDAIAQLYYGDLHRLQAQRAPAADRRAEHARQALARYELAARLDPTLAEPYRQLGLLHYQQGDAAAARAAFARYLALRPEAPDAERIRAYVTELER